jgi:hypothetical protein
MLATPAFFLLVGLSFLAGFAIGMTVEHANLRIRERQLAHGRRVIAAQARGLRHQMETFYRLREGAANSQTLEIVEDGQPSINPNVGPRGSNPEPSS